MTLSIGDKAPDFSMPSDGGGNVSLSDFKDRYLVLYFYPKDDTPGCTKEAIGFTESKAEFDALNASILGVSKDTPAKHDKFIAKHDLKVGLGSDESGEMIESKYMGIERATYLIGPEGTILEIWRKVRVKDHVAAVLTAVQKHAA